MKVILHKFRSFKFVLETHPFATYGIIGGFVVAVIVALVWAGGGKIVVSEHGTEVIIPQTEINRRFPALIASPQITKAPTEPPKLSAPLTWAQSGKDSFFLALVQNTNFGKNQKFGRGTYDIARYVEGDIGEGEFFFETKTCPRKGGPRVCSLPQSKRYTIYQWMKNP